MAQDMIRLTLKASDIKQGRIERLYVLKDKYGIVEMNINNNIAELSYSNNSAVDVGISQEDALKAVDLFHNVDVQFHTQLDVIKQEIDAILELEKIYLKMVKEHGKN